VDQLIDELTAEDSSRKLTAHKADMASDSDLNRLYDEIRTEHGHGPDILIANAGYGKRTSNILEIDIEEWDYTINVNLPS
jgi:3-oxoacyl-[acyl-carrier protein] reductase